MATASFGLGSGTAALACLVDTYLKDLGCAKPVKALLFFSFFFHCFKTRHSGSHERQAHLTCQTLASWDCSWDMLRLAVLDKTAE
jgi:hypothetical protein